MRRSSQYRILAPQGDRALKALLWFLFSECLLGFAAPLTAATYYVSLAGNDSNPGSSSLPWRNIGKAANLMVAGDTVIIGPGEYDEHVSETTSGAPDSFITYRASQPYGASLRAFRLGGQYIRIDGLKLTRYSGVENNWGAAIRIEAAAHNSVITNCWISDAPYVIAHDFRFNHIKNEVISLSSDFVKAGFLRGSKVYLGSSGFEGLYYTNHDTSWIVASNTATRMWLTNAAGSRFAPDTGSNYWAVIRPGGSGLFAINCARSGGSGATNVVISGNTISNWMARAIFLCGRGGRVENNYATKLLSFYFLAFEGSDLIIRGNVVRNSPNILHYSDVESSTLIHPEGTGWFDHVMAMTRGESADSAQVRTNILFERNWFEDIENQIGRVNDEQADTYDITYANNVFIGISMHFSGGRDGMRWISNTFYRCGFESGGPLTLGGRPPAQSNYVLLQNLFIDSGTYDRSDSSGWYGISTNAIDPVADSNMVAGVEMTGFAPKRGFGEPNGINGGDPGFLSVLDFDGLDDRPFTADDGLQVLPNSLAATLGGGALGVYRLTTDYPVAHFRISSPQGWFEPTGTNYNPSWWANTPTRRQSVVRPFTTPQTIGQAPIDATFDAGLSLSGVNGSLTSASITNYSWDFGDGVTVSRSTPLVSHRFVSPGDRIVGLTVRNTAGNSHTVSNVYRIAGTENRPSPPQGLRVVQ